MCVGLESRLSVDMQIRSCLARLSQERDARGCVNRALNSNGNLNKNRANLTTSISHDFANQSRINPEIIFLAEKLANSWFWLWFTVFCQNIMPSLDELTRRYAVVRRRLQDSVKMMEAFMGRHLKMYFNVTSILESLEVVELNTVETKVEQWKNVMSD